MVAVGHKLCALVLMIVPSVLPRVGTGGIPNGHAIEVVLVSDELCKAQHSTAQHSMVSTSGEDMLLNKTDAGS